MDKSSVTHIPLYDILSPVGFAVPRSKCRGGGRGYLITGITFFLVSVCINLPYTNNSILKNNFGFNI